MKTPQTNMYFLKTKRDGIFPGLEDIHLSDLGAPSHPMEASIENAKQASDEGKQMMSQRSLLSTIVIRE